MAETVPFQTPNEDDDTRGETSASAKEPRTPSQSYTSEEVSEIIRVGLKNAEVDQQDRVTHDEMLSIGRDFGLGESDISDAFKEITRARAAEEQTSHATVELKLHALMTVAISTFLFIINALTMSEFWWAFIPVSALTILLAVHAVMVRYMPALSNRLFVNATAASKDWAQSRVSTNELGSAATFTIPDLYQSLAAATGIARVQDNHLCLEFEVRDTVFGALKSQMKEVRVPLSEIANVRLERVFWTTKLTMQSHRLKSFEHVPGHSSGKIVLAIDRQGQAAAEKLAAEIAERIS